MNVDYGSKRFFLPDALQLRSRTHAARGRQEKKLMKTMKLLVLALLAAASVGQAFAACERDSDRASDGSRCGGRSSDSRPGGK